MSTVQLSTSPRRRLAVPGLRGTGLVGHISAAVIALAALIAIFGEALALYDPDGTNLSLSFVGPLGDHYLGFDSQGRDLLSRILTGARSSLVGPAIVVVLSIVVGTALAVATAWRGGIFDNVVSSGLDVLFAFPAIVLAIMASVVWGAGLRSATIALAVAYTPYIARILRGAALRERAREYVAALEVQGLRATAICVRHIARNLLPLIAAQGAILFGYAIVDLAAISFIGLGVQPPQADWGVMVANGQSGVLQGYPMESLAAGLCIVLVVVAVNLLGERLTDRAEEVAR
ncbi:MAG TPA: ABC transporter permease [Ilumatobacteraceae bacterium]|nr:ABC transporter permease [Ilumatobacteraceae bacterium]